jgi:hypothetical protein
MPGCSALCAVCHAVPHSVLCCAVICQCAVPRCAACWPAGRLLLPGTNPSQSCSSLPLELLRHLLAAKFLQGETPALLAACCMPLSDPWLSGLLLRSTEYRNLYELFHARAAMHRAVYTHK